MSRLVSFSTLIGGVILWSMGAVPAVGQVSPDSLSATRIQESIEAVLGTGHSVTWNAHPLSEADKKTLRPSLQRSSSLPDTLYVGHVSTSDGDRFLIPDATPSKSKTFSLLLYLDDAGSIVDVDVLKYRENYGYEVDYPMFRQQFQGAKQGEEIRFQRTIQNISGATISARSMTHAVHDLLVIVRHVGLNTFR